MKQKSQFKHFKFTDEDGFLWKEEYVGFDAIRHLFFSWVRTTQRDNFIKVGEPEKARLIITLVDDRKIKITFNEATIFVGLNRNKKNEIESLKQLYYYLSQQSFEHRLAHYLRELEDNGYFEYDKCRFYPKKQVIVFRKKAFPLATYTLLRGKGYVEIRKKTWTFAEKIKREFAVTKLPHFETQTDTDVIYALLGKFFGIQWAD